MTEPGSRVSFQSPWVALDYEQLKTMHLLPMPPLSYKLKCESRIWLVGDKLLTKVRRVSFNHSFWRLSVQHKASRSR